MLALLVLGRFILGRSLCEEDRFFTQLLLLLNHCINERRGFTSSGCGFFTLVPPKFLNSSRALIFSPVALKKAILARSFLFWLYFCGLTILFRLIFFKEKGLSFTIVIVVEIVKIGKPEQHGASLESRQPINHSSDHGYSGFDLILSQKIM